MPHTETRRNSSIDGAQNRGLFSIALSGKRNPYLGQIGVVKEGALADLLLVDGDPVADISLVTRPDKSFKIIMKDGGIYKNTLP